MEPNKFMEEKKKLEEDYLESAKAKLAILSRFNWYYNIIFIWS